MFNKTRGELSLFYDILKSVEKNNGEIRWTRLLSNSNTNQLLLKRYIEKLINLDFVEVQKDGNKKTIKTKINGFNYVALYEQLMKLVDKDVIKNE